MINRKAFTIFILLLTGCAGNDRPDWIENPSANYPQAQYLTATGSATAPEDAGTRALGNLAKIFEVKIEETARDESSAWRSTENTEITSGSSQITARYIDSYTTKLLEGARIVETWEDNEKGSYYALAAISRPQLSMQLRQKINQADSDVAKRITQANHLNDPFIRAQKLYSTRSILLAREQSQQDLRIVDRAGVGVPPKWTLKDLDVRVDAELAKMTVSETVLQDLHGELGKSLQGAIAAMGMKYAKTDTVYDLQGKLDLQDVGMQQGWYWYRGALQVDMLANAGNKVMASVRFPLKSSGQSQQQSLTRMQNEITRLLNNELKHALLSFGNTETIQE